MVTSARRRRRDFVMGPLVLAWLTGILSVLAALEVEDADASTYCNLCSDHTMCQYKGPNPHCRDLFSRDLSLEERRAALHAHNSVRNRVAAGEENRGYLGRTQPQAANMRKLHWDEELATMARRWAMQCTFDQDTCRTSLDGWSVGQNIYMQMSAPGSMQPPTVSVPLAVRKWYDEVDFYDGHQATEPYAYSVATWHYTNVIWARSSRLGCGFADFSASGALPARLIVCNYKEAGNVVGSSVYTVGRPGTLCSGETLPQAQPPWPPDTDWDLEKTSGARQGTGLKAQKKRSRRSGDEADDKPAPWLEPVYPALCP